MASLLSAPHHQKIDTAAGSLRVQLCHPSCQPPTESIFNRIYLFPMDSETNQLPFGCDKTRKQPLPASCPCKPQEEDEKQKLQRLELLLVKDLLMLRQRQFYRHRIRGALPKKKQERH